MERALEDTKKDMKEESTLFIVLAAQWTENGRSQSKVNPGTFQLIARHRSSITRLLSETHLFGTSESTTTPP